MIVPHPERYRIVEGRSVTGESLWSVHDPRRDNRYNRRLSIYFPTRAEAERCRDALLKDDARAANE